MIDSAPGWLCLKNSAAILGNVGIEEKGAEVLARAGRPLSQRTDSTEDDGGVYAFVRYRFPGLEFDVDQRFDDIERLFTKDSTSEGPAGLRVGMHAPDVWRRLGIPTQDIKGQAWTIPLCGENGFVAGEERFAVGFAGVASDARVDSIAILQYGP